MNNMSMLINMLKSSGNPQMMLQNMVQQQAQNNPMMKNVLGIMQGNNAAGAEIIARNLCKEKGIDADVLMNQIKNQFK